MGNVLDKVSAEGEEHCMSPSIGCAFCSRIERLRSFEDLRPGDHICLGGHNFMRYVDREQKYLYKHHAIVREVFCEKGTNHRAVISCIHFSTTPFNAGLRIRETSELRDLKVDELYVVRYKLPKFQPQVVLDRAQKALDQDPKYSVLFLNCEHFCNWCVNGVEFSGQVEKVKEKIRSFFGSLGGPGMKIAKLIIQFAGLTADDFASLALKLAPTIIQTVFLIIFLIRNIYFHLTLFQTHRAGQICIHCYMFNTRSAWLSFGLVSIPTILSIIACLTIPSTAFLIAVLAPLSIISLVFLWGSSTVLKAVRSPFSGETKKVTDIGQICIGDVIQYRYWGLQHEAVVSFVQVHDSKSGKVRIVHYALRSLLSTREIVEEDLEIDIEKKDIFKLDYSGNTVYSPDDVVRRARQRIGERKFGLFTNRSCHVCHWAKVDKRFVKPLEPNDDMHLPSDLPESARQIYLDQSAGRARSTSLIHTVSAIVKTDVRAGDLIEFWYHKHWHKAVCTEVILTDTEAKLEIRAVHYSYEGIRTMRQVKEERFTFNLLEKYVYVYHYHPVHRYSRQEIIKRAKEKIGEQTYSNWFRNSKHLAEEITLIDKEEVINDPSGLSEGDIVSFTYWGFRHKGVLVSISGKSSDTKVEMTVIHYALMNWRATRTIVEETFKKDLKEKDLRKISFSEYNTYPGKVVVLRAKQRVGEQKFDMFSNTSNHLVHWAKVDNRMKIGVILRETAEIVFKDPEWKDTTDQNVPFEQEEGISMYPASGKSTKQLHMETVRSWEEFIPGRMVEYKYFWIWHRGILTEVLPNQKKIKIIHYGANHLFATRTIVLDERVVDLRWDKYYIYHPDPAYAYERQDAIRSAKARLGEQDWREGNRSYDFCRTCILNPFAREANALSMKHVKTWEEFIVGCIVDFRYRLKRHQGILTEILSQQRKIKVIHFGFGEKSSASTVLEDLIEVDFLRETFYIYHPHPKHAFQQEETIKNARKSIGERKWKSAPDFCRACVLKE